MDALFTAPFIGFIQNLSPEVLSFLTFLICIASLLVMLRLFGVTGLYVYNAVVIISANIQVLKVVSFWPFPEPVALGTIAFATTFLTSDILTEHYGQAVARKGVWLGFAAQVFMTIMMVLPLGYAALPGDKVHEAMMVLFSPSPRVLVASLLAYALSQFIDIFLFQWVGQVTKGRRLWLRTNIAGMFSALVDNIVFSALAWVILSPAPVSFSTLIFTYILGTYGARVVMAILSTPVMYLSYWCLPKSSPLQGT